MGKETKTIIALVAILVVCASVAIIGLSESLAGDESVTTVGTYFDDTSGITYTLYSNETAQATKIAGSPAEVTVLGTVTVDSKQYSVVSVDGQFGYRDKNVEQVTFSSSITELKDATRGGVFSEATKLKKVVFEQGSKLTYVGDKAFSGCMVLEQLELPEGLTEIGDNVLSCTSLSSKYYNLYSLKELTLPATLQNIGDGSLPNLMMDIKLAEGNTSFTIENGILYDKDKKTLIRAFNPQGDVKIPDTVERINSKAFNFQTSDVMGESTYKSLGYAANPIDKDPNIGTVTIGSGIKEIGSNAFSFYNISGVSSKSPYSGLVIPEKMQATIGTQAFAYNSLVKEMYVGSQQVVAKDAYQGCNEIETAYILHKDITTQYNNIGAKTLILSKELNSISNSSISGWKNLKSVSYEGRQVEVGKAILPATLQNLGTNAFKNSAIEVLDLTQLELETISGFSELGSVKSIYFGNKVTKITGFSNLTSLTSVEFPESLTTIADSTFVNCKALATVKFNGKLTAIGDYAFNGCEGLTSITFGDGLKTIGNDAFKDCSGLKEITFGSGLTTIGNWAFQNIAVTGIAFPDSLETIGQGAFKGCTKLESVTFGNKLTTIGANAFESSTSLKSITFPGSLTTIGSKAFNKCTGITTIEFQEGVKQIVNGRFQDLTSLTKVVFPSTLTSVGKSSFQGCTSLAEIEIPKTATMEAAFGSCGAYPDSQDTDRYLKILTISYKGTTEKAKWVLGVDSNLPEGTVVKIPSGVAYIDITENFLKNIGGFRMEDPQNSTYVLDTTGGALYSSDGKTLYCVRGNAILNGEFTVPKDVTEIGPYSFSNLTQLNKISFEDGSALKTIGKNAFIRCTSLTSLTCPASLELIDQSAFQQSGLTTVDFSNVTVTLTIGQNAFYNSSGLATALFSQAASVVIGNYAFNGTSLTSVIVYGGEIGSGAFNDCSKLESITLGSQVTKTNNNYLRGTSSLKQIIILNKSGDVIGKTILVTHINSTADFVIIVPEDSEADYSTFEAKYSLSKMVLLKNGRSFFMSPAIDGITITKDKTTDSSVTYKYVLSEECNRSEVEVKLGDTSVDLQDGMFTITPGESVETVSITGVEINKYSVNFEAHNATIKGFVSYVEHGKDITFNIIPRSGYELKDAKAVVGQTEYAAGENGSIKITSVVNDISIRIEGILPSNCHVTFIKDGKVIDVSEVKFGDTVSPNEQSQSWYLYNSTTAFDFNQKIESDTILFDSSVGDDSKVAVNFYAARGSIDASWVGGSIENNGTVLKGSDVTFTYDGGGSYDVVGWFVNGKYSESSERSITISNVNATVSVQIAVVYEQAGYKYIVNAPMILPDEEYQKMLWIGSYKDPLTPSYQSNMPSAYTVVGDYLYMVLDHKEIVRVDLNADFSSGLPTNTLRVVPEIVDSTIDYCGGYIFNGTHVYDLDLNYLLDVDATPIGMHDGKFVSLSNNRVTKYTIQSTGDGYKFSEIWSLALEKHYGMTFIDGDYLYHLPVSTSVEEPYRAIQSIDLVDGKIEDTVDISQWQYGHYYDDGWLTVYDGWAYIASYTVGLFGETNPIVTARSPVLLRVAVENGVFDKDSVQTMELPNNTQQSGLIVYKDRGYIHSGGTLLVIDMDTFTLIYSEVGTKTHGGIVLNTYYATSDNDYQVYIYMIPYANAETMWVYTDNQSKTEAGTPQKIENVAYSQYATTHVRTSASGYIYGYNDSSIFFIAGQKYHDVSYVVDGVVIKSQNNVVNGSALTLPAYPQKDGYAFVGWYNYDGASITKNSVVTGDMTIMAVYAPIAGDSELIDSVSIKQFINGGKSVMLSVDSGMDAPEKVLVITYSGYIDLPEGRILNPFLTECIELTKDQNEAIFTPTLASKIESLTVTCCYEIDSVLYSTPYVKAMVPTTYAIVDLSIDSSLTLSLNDLTVTDGQSMRYGYYVVKVEGDDDAQYQVNGIVADGKNRMFYYGQSLIVTKVEA